MTYSDLARFQSDMRRVIRAGAAGKLWDPGWCYGCGEPGPNLRWWMLDQNDPVDTAVRLCQWCRQSWKIDPKTREMIKAMATFHTWLTGHETGPSDDPVAWLARQWKACEGNRPKVSSPTGIEKHLLKPTSKPDGIEQASWDAGVHESIAAATDRYRADKAREQAGLPATSSGETTPPAGDTNPATGKPVAVVKQGEWVERPQADKFGSCGVCGWALGIADRGHGPQSMCAAGHVNGRPGAKPEWADPDAQPHGHPMPSEAPGPPERKMTQLGRIELMLAAICATLGLPGDNPDALAGLIAAAAQSDGGEPDSELLSQQLAPTAAERVVTGHGSVPSPADFASWYGMADPAAQGEPDAGWPPQGDG